MMAVQMQPIKNVAASDVARYFLYRAEQDGELVSPLKMQKLVYYAYVWTLIKNRKKLFDENIQAWPNGPVVPSLYRDLKKYGSMPIRPDFAGSQEKVTETIGKFPPKVKSTLDAVYDEYMTKTAFELVVMTHHDKPWVEARKGLQPNQKTEKPISDENIIEQYND